MKKAFLLFLVLCSCSQAPGAPPPDDFQTITPSANAPKTMPDGGAVFGPPGYYDYCRRHLEDTGCSR